MKNLILFLFGFLAIMTSCQKDEIRENETLISENDFLETDDQNISALKNLIEIYKNAEGADFILNQLKSQDSPQLLSSMINSSTLMSLALKETIKMQTFISSLDTKNKANPITAKVPEIWLFNKKTNFKSDDVLFLYAPEFKIKEGTKSIKAYDVNGKVVPLDINVEPNAPVIIIDNASSKAAKIKVDAINKEFQKLGMQDVSKDVSTQKMASPKTVIKSMRLKNDHEWWWAGAAEIYALVSGVKKNNEKNEQVYMYNLPTVNHQNKTYSLNTKLIDWNLIGYDKANISFMEQDYGNVSKYIRKAKDIITSENARPKDTKNSTLQTFISFLGNLIAFIPDNFFNNDDDNVDDYYSIVKGTSYTNKVGKRNNATITLKYAK